MTELSPTSTELDVPAVIDRYLRAHDRRDTDAARSTFAANATVVDDGQRYVGADRIREWLANVSTQFSYTRTLTAVDAVDADTWLVTNRLEGDFPGGVVDLGYQFRVWWAMRSWSCSSLRDAPRTPEFWSSLGRPSYLPEPAFCGLLPRPFPGRDYRMGADGPIPSGHRCLEDGAMPRALTRRALPLGARAGRYAQRQMDLFRFGRHRPRAWRFGTSIARSAACRRAIPDTR